MSDPSEVLRKCPLLAALTDDDIETLAQVARHVHAPRGESIWLHGGQVDFIGAIERGFVKMVRHESDGVEVVHEIFGPRQVFGLLGVLDGCGCPMNASAVTALDYWRIPKSTMEAVYVGNHAFKDQLIRKSSLRIHQKFSLMIHLAVGKADQRVAAILLVLLDSYGHQLDDGRWQVDVPLTRQEIAEMAGVTPETAIRIISRWQKEGWAETSDHHVIVERERLAAIAR